MRLRHWTTAVLTMALFVAGCGAEQPGPYAPGDAARGHQVFIDTCAQCHGADALGIPDKGKNLVQPSEELAKKTEEELYKWLRLRHDPVLPKMPNMNDQKLRDAEAYILSIRVK